MVIITRKDLSAGYKVVQSCHVVAEYAAKLKEEFIDWKINSNIMVCLEEEDEISLIKAKHKLIECRIPFVEFYEEDIGNQLTSIAFIGNESKRKKFSHLPLTLKSFQKNV